MLTDAHAHFCRPDELVARRGIRTLFCGTDPETAAQALALPGNHPVSCGLHPWHADRRRAQDMLPFIRRSVALGEIGLDSVWTGADMARQREAFVWQLELAAQLDMPVILHTKGMEREVANTVARYPVRKLVHWYSCDEHLSLYLDQDCWFTVGPDWAVNPAVRQVLRRAPLERILTETDGLDAIAWAQSRPAEPGDIRRALRGELRAIADAHGITPDEAEAQVAANLDRFLYGREKCTI